jgi:hypothetical protein
MQKDILRILFEALIVGLLLILVYNPINYILKDYDNNLILFISGSIFHIICEYTGINLWYVEDYNKILKINILNTNA